MSVARTFASINIILRAHVLNWFWRGRAKRRAVRCSVLSDLVTKYLKRHLPAAAAIPERKVIKDDKNEKIFTLWLQGEENAPPLVQACFRSIRRHCAQELIVLDARSVFDYITLPQKIIDKYKTGKIGHAHFADICRVELLYEHGGFWMDATGFVTAPIPDWIVNQDFFVFMVGSGITNPYSYSFMQNCFIRARRGAYLLDAWRAMMLDYWRNEDHNIDYMMHQLMFKALVMNDPRAKKYFEKMPHVDQRPTHALWWAYGNKPFDQETFDRVTSGAFFQKTNYNSPWVKNIGSGTFADVMVNKM